MTYAIIGAGAVGQALAKMFGRKGIEVAIASTRAPKALAPLATVIGTTVIPSSLNEAINADIILLAVPFWAHGEVAKHCQGLAGQDHYRCDERLRRLTKRFGQPPVFGRGRQGVWRCRACQGVQPPACRRPCSGALHRPLAASGFTLQRQGQRPSGGVHAGRATRLCTGQPWKARRGWAAHSGARKHLGAFNFQRSLQEAGLSHV